MWGLKENNDKDYREHHREFQQGLVGKDKVFAVTENIDRFYILGQWMAPLKLCTKLETLPAGNPCKAWMNANGMPITVVAGVKTFDFDMATYKKWQTYWETEVMGKEANLKAIIEGVAGVWKGDS